jgi:hypothetical protein
LVAVVLMLGGLALLGTLAGSLGAFLRIQDTGDGSDEPEGEEPATATGAPDGSTAAELAALRVELADVNRRLAALQVHLGVTDAGAPGRHDD